MARAAADDADGVRPTQQEAQLMGVHGVQAIHAEHDRHEDQEAAPLRAVATGEDRV